jgi:uncharacterized protein (DUF433 family)
MEKTVEIVERGRGPQLSTSRITVQDLVPYFQRKLAYEQIMDIVPDLTIEEIKAIERFIRDNYDAVMEQDRRIRERNALRRTSPEVEEIVRRGGEKMAVFRQKAKTKKHWEGNGDNTVA